MIFDLNLTAPSERHAGYDVCIVGAGVAGITLALDLADSGHRVLLLEAGGLEYNDASQDLYRGESAGRSYFELDATRLRFLGGSSNHWAGRCRPLDAEDFAVHAHVPGSGWPIGKSDLDPYLRRSCEILEMPADFVDETVDDASADFREVAFQHSTPVRFGEKYFAAIRAHDAIDLFLNANVVDVVANDARDRVEAVTCRNYREDDPPYTFSASLFVLACGGIETPRMMLNHAARTPGLFADNVDLIGRYFMEHPEIRIGYYAATREAWPYEGSAQLATVPRLRGDLRLANALVELHRFVGPPKGTVAQLKQEYVCATDAVREFVAKFHDIWCPTEVYSGGGATLVLEQVPNPDSRVTLSDDTDAFGLRRVKLDWRFTELDHVTSKQTALGFAKHLAASKFGNMKLSDWVTDPDAPIPDTDDHAAGHHHMGTTRMSDDPKAGVVNRDCRVFGVDNLYVAGSSVFPTAGYANPTLTIVQMTLRLGQHLAGLRKS